MSERFIHLVFSEKEEIQRTCAGNVFKIDDSSNKHCFANSSCNGKGKQTENVAEGI